MSIALALSIALAITFLLQARLDESERRLVWGAFLAHLLGTGGLLWLHETTGSDMVGYAGNGMNIAALLRIDFTRWLPEIAKIVLGGESDLPIIDTTTGKMSALCGLVFFMVGDSLAAACILVGSFVLVGQVLLYRVFRAELPIADRPVAAMSCLLVPSVMFWTSGLVKEAFSLAGLGILAYGLHAALARRNIFGAPLAVCGAVLVAAVKPYTLLPVVLAVSAWVFSARTGGKIRPAYALGALGMGVLGVALIGQIFPQYGFGQLPESLARARFYSGQAGGGSYVGDDDGGVDVGRADTSVAGGLKYLPMAVVSALFRPFLFEVRNVTQLGAALETTVLFVLVVALVWRVRVRQVFDATLRSPPLFASIVFVLSFGAAVGLASQNMGTVSRYRVPMMPFYTAVVLLLRRHLSPAALAGALRPPLAPAPTLAATRGPRPKRARRVAAARRET